MGQDIFDLIVVVSLLLYAINGVRVGFVREVAGIAGLVLAFWAARAYNGQLAPYLGFISDPAWRPITACVIIFVAVMILVGVLARLLEKILSFSFVGWLNKLGGLFFGLAKGILIWALIFIVLDKVAHGAQFMQESRVLPYFSALIDYIKPWLPPEISSHIGL